MTSKVRVLLPPPPKTHLQPHEEDPGARARMLSIAMKMPCTSMNVTATAAHTCGSFSPWDSTPRASATSSPTQAAAFASCIRSIGTKLAPDTLLRANINRAGLDIQRPQTTVAGTTLTGWFNMHRLGRFRHRALPRVPHHALAGVRTRDVGELALEGGRGRPAVEPFLFH